MVVPFLVAMAFITLLERKILGYRQLRKGPNKVGFAGIPQPFNDAIKLFSKERVTPIRSNPVLYNLRPAIAIILSMLVWFSFPLRCVVRCLSLGIIFIYVVIRINIYPLIASGWASNRNYASIGALRGVAQTISYEVRFALLLIFFVLTLRRFSLTSLRGVRAFWLNALIFPPILGLWLITRLAETNRTPFDFAEGESELVSGFNVEYGRVGFALLFMAEYLRIYFISFLFRLVFFPWGLSSIYFYLIPRGLVFFWVWVRCTLPRYRYDMLIRLAWVTFLPLALLILIYLVGLIL